MENDFNNNFEEFYSTIKLTIESDVPLNKLSIESSSVLKTNLGKLKVFLFPSKRNKNCIKLTTYLDYLQKKSIANCILTH